MWVVSPLHPLGPWFAHSGLLVMAGNIVPLDSVSIEVVQDTQANLWMWRVLPSSSVVWLWKVGSSSMRPMSRAFEADMLSIGIVPCDHLVPMVHHPTCPKVPLSILSNQPVEVVLFGWGIQGHRFHPHGLTVGLGLVLLEGGTSDLPGGNIPSCNIISWIFPEVIRTGWPTETCPPYKGCWGLGSEPRGCSGEALHRPLVECLLLLELSRIPGLELLDAWAAESPLILWLLELVLWS